MDLIIPELAKRDAAEARRIAAIELGRIEAYLAAGFDDVVRPQQQ